MAAGSLKRRAADRILQALGVPTDWLSAEDVHKAVNCPDHRWAGDADLTLGTVKNTLTALYKQAAVSRDTDRPTGVGKGVRYVYSVRDHVSPIEDCGDAAKSQVAHVTSLP